MQLSLSLLNKLVSKGLVVGLPSIKYNDGKVYDACARGKQVINSFKLKNMSALPDLLSCCVWICVVL